MIPSCPNTELEHISTSFINFPVDVGYTHSPAVKEQRIMLSIANLKRYLLTDGHKLVMWSFNTFLSRFCRTQKDPKTSFGPLEKTLLDFLTSCLSFLEATNNSAMGTLFEMAKDVYQELPNQTVSIVALVSDDIPKCMIAAFHRYLISQLADTGNPITTMEVESDQVNPVTRVCNFGRSIWNAFFQRHESLVRDSIMDLLDSYLIIVDGYFTGDQSLLETSDSMLVDKEQDIGRFTLGYLLALPMISELLTEECWAQIFRKLYDHNRVGSLLLFEKNVGYSLIRDASGSELIKVNDVFALWLSKVAFVPDGVVMKHALDIAVIVDTVVYDHRLNLQHLLPANGTSIMDSFLPSLTNSGISPPSIDLVDEWILPILDLDLHKNQAKSPREVYQLKIPVFFLKLALLKDDTLQTALDLLIKLMSHLPVTTINTLDTTTTTNRYLLLTMIETAETKWPSFYSNMLEQLFSKAMALNITGNNEDVSKVETIFGNLAILSDEKPADQTKIKVDMPPIPSSLHQSFADYISSHCRQIMLLFINHPSTTCRAMGYRVLSNSRFWEQDQQSQPTDTSAICKSLSDSWFRLLKTRYNLAPGEGDDDDGSVPDEKLDIGLVELQNLITQCCLHGTTSSTMTDMILDSILNGGLETFPRTDISLDSYSKSSSLLGRITQNSSSSGGRLSQSQHGIPRYIPHIEVLKSDLNIKDSVYRGNIERTAAILREVLLKESDGGRLLLTIIQHRFPISSPSSLESYDQALPHQIPYAHDITNGGAFKDHPALFLILDQCLATDRESSMPLVRSVFIYFITFWNLAEVASKPLSLYFATQLEETLHLLHWMEWMIPDKLRNIGAILPFVSGGDVGAILYKVIWPCTRRFYDTSGTPAREPIDAADPLFGRCIQEVKTIYQHRKHALAGHQGWADALDKIAMGMNLTSFESKSDNDGATPII